MSEVELPEGWDEALMSDVTADVPSEDPARDPDRVFAYIDISAIDNRRFAITSDEVKEFRGRDAPSRARRPVRPADVLYSNVRTYLRNIALVEAGVPADLCSTGFTVLRSNGVIEPEYLFRWVLTEEFLELISPHETGTHYPATSDRAVRALPIRVPPLAEQRRIVEKVEALLAQVNAARARLAKVPTILKRFRQSILSAACSGRLTEGWRLAQESVVDEEDWNESKFGDLLAVKPQNGLYRPQEDYGSGTPIVRIDSFYEGEIGAWNDLKKLRATKDDVRTYGLQPGDLLINRVNSPKFLGKSALVRSVPEPTVFESNIMRCHPDESRLFPEFAVRFLSSLEGLEELRKNAKHAVNQSSINQRDVMDVSVPVPHLPEQHEIVRRVEALFKLADTIEASVAAATARADKITQAILAKAFRGELVPTEAELARQEDRDYEPASALLARIRAARAAEPPERGTDARRREKSRVALSGTDPDRKRREKRGI